MIQLALARLLDGRDLTRSEAREVMDQIMRGEATAAQIGAFLVAMRIKSETPDEIARLRRGDARSRAPDPSEALGPRRHGRDGRRRRANVQHLDGRSARRRRGRRRGREARKPRRLVGLRLGRRPRGARLRARAPGGADRALDRRARLRVPVRARRIIRPCATRRPIRRELATRTVFNVLGPLTNPAGARAQVVGVYAPELVPTIAAVLVQLGAEHAFVVHGADGIDELSPTGPNLVCRGDRRRRSRERVVDPLDLGIPRCAPSELSGDSPAGQRCASCERSSPAHRARAATPFS